MTELVWPEMVRTPVKLIAEGEYQCRIKTKGGDSWLFTVSGCLPRYTRDAAQAIVALGEKGKKK